MTDRQHDSGKKKRTGPQYRVAEVRPPENPQYHAAVVKTEGRNPFRPIAPAQPPESVRKAAELKRQQEAERLEEEKERPLRPRRVRSFWWDEGSKELKQEKWLASVPKVERFQLPTPAYDFGLSPMKDPPGLFAVASIAPEKAEAARQQANRDLALMLADVMDERRLLRRDRHEAIIQTAEQFREWELEEAEILFHGELLQFREDFPELDTPETDPTGILEEPLSILAELEINACFSQDNADA